MRLADALPPAPEVGPAQALRVRRYYDRNTPWMLRLGAGRTEAVIHRPVWLEGAHTRREALRTAERLIAESLALEPLPWRAPLEVPVRHLLDLGCGVGSSALWLAERFSVSVTGVTVSPRQAQEAAARALRKGLQDRCRFLAGDFLALPNPAPVRPPAQAAYAVEAFSHAAAPGKFFEAAAGWLDVGGRLAICDDFLAEPPPEPRRREATSGPGSSRRKSGGKGRRARCLARLRRGWNLGSLVCLTELQAQAAAAGFSLLSCRDLTPGLRLQPRIWQLPQAALGLALAGTPWGASRLGGAALQRALRAGWVRYLFLVLKRR